MRDLDRIQQKIVIQMDNRQVAIAVLGLLLVSTGIFATGVLVGQQAGDRLLDALGAGPGDLADGDGIRTEQEPSRIERLTRVLPGTRAVSAELALPPPQVQTDDPTDAARIEAHRQIAAANAGAAARDARPLAIVEAAEPAPVVAPLTVVERSPAAEDAALAVPPSDTRYALQVSAFGAPEPARLVADQLRTAGHAVQVREATGDDGAPMWRVEVGPFDDVRSASDFQRQFERSAGYPTVMVPVR
ncbi:MAG: SPOR domain-containing protein [Deltaproteobacteria bacterium]|nr:SPOR domain-containing protein [Deltaproteobacteria bacterium]MCB9785959.1 SPOR domain-containing protein [Deltaproteobacteria bacterium]